MNDRNRLIVAVVCSVALVLALSSLVYRRLHRPKVDDPTAQYQGMGEAVAEEAAKLTGGEGKLILVAEPGALGKKSVAEAMQRGSGGKVAAVARTQPLDGDGLAELAKQNGASAVVVFEGSVDVQKLRAEAKPGAGIVLVTGDWDAAKDLLQKKVIRAAIVPRTHYPPEGLPLARTPRERFDNGYEIIDAANADKLPSLPK